MSAHYYGITVPGEQLNGASARVSKSTSTTSRNVELVVTDGVTGMTKEQLLNAIEAIENYIVTDSAPA